MKNFKSNFMLIATTLLIGVLVGVAGTYLFQKRCKLCTLAKSYREKEKSIQNKIAPIQQADSDAMNTAYKTDPNFKDQPLLIKTDAASFAYYMDSLGLTKRTDSIEFHFSKHVEDLNGKPYKDKLTATVSFTRVENAKKVTKDLKIGDATTKSLDVFTLSPPDAP